MSTAKITSKRQITVPKDVCQELGVDVGDELEFVRDRGVVSVRRRFDPKALDKWRGYLKNDPKLRGKTTDQIIEEMRGPVDLD